MTGWLQLTFNDRKLHYFKGGEGLIKSACGVYFNSKWLIAPNHHDECEACREKAPRRVA